MDDFLGGQRLFVESRAQALATNHLHDVVEAAALQASEVVDSDDVGVADARDQLGFHLEAAGQLGAGAELGL